MLVFEGIMPFLDPERFRRTLLGAARLRAATLRAVGLLSMLIGVLLLYAAR